jgi:hypothetical protein
MTSPTINSALFCDEVRREQNGKLFIIGMYGNRIFSAKFPATLRFWAALNVHFSAAGPQALKIRLNAGKSVLQEISIEVDVAWPGSDWLPVPFEAAVFEGPSEMSLSYEAKNGKWKKFYSMPIENFPAVTA